MSFTLYYARQSCALSVHLALEEFEVPYKATLIKLRSGEHQTPWFTQLNPAQRVPVFVTDRGVITETPAILCYIQLYVHARTGGSAIDDYEICQINSLNSWLASTMHVAHAHRVRGERWASDPAAIDEMSRHAVTNMEKCCAFIERHYVKEKFAIGDVYTVCDPYLFAMIFYAMNDGVELNNYPHLVSYWNRIASRPATRRILSLHKISLDILPDAGGKNISGPMGDSGHE
ncbi:glutathione S-transferase family protein [Acetobacter sicerae]|uniref:Glutathione S-transferase family protein n=1 Tax=Acetobacter sicerae TaxID=85325 RepID=A0ABS8VUM0_9PROT|nr:MULTISPECIES: glutathione S-transferase family protein [Acetobacter]MBC9008941.1 glutathione S-transferase family protein [Acetobacter tropicalis]MCE0743894.1 glutathione S-transferase family protein [Acetobacter sicerae]